MNINVKKMGGKNRAGMATGRAKESYNITRRGVEELNSSL